MILKILTVLTLANGIIAATSRFPQFQNLTGVDPNSLQCDPDGLKPLLLPHHEDCDKFYMCTHGQEVLFSCPDGTVFDFERQTCNWPHDVECILRDQLKDSSEESEEDGSGGGGVEWEVTDDGWTHEPESSTTQKPHSKPPKPNHKPPKPDHKPPKPENKPSKPDHKPPQPDNKPQKPDQNLNGNHSHHHHHGNHPQNSKNNRNENNRNRNRDDQRRKAERKLKCDDPKNAGRQKAHSTNCQLYWRCEDGNLHQRSCSEGLFYNGKTQQCDHEGNVKCDTNNDELNNEYIVA